MDSSTDDEQYHDNFLSSDRIKEIKTWLNNSKNYTKSGVFTRLHNDISSLIDEKIFNIRKYENLNQNTSNLLEQNNTFQEIIQESSIFLKGIFTNLEIDEEPESLVKGLKIIENFTKNIKYPQKISSRSLNQRYRR